jgi:hypothetical protein
MWPYRVAALDTWPHTVWLVSREAPLVYPPLSHAQPLHGAATIRAPLLYIKKATFIGSPN